MVFLPFCWLVPGDPGPFPAPFDRTSDDLNRFKKWFSVLTSIKDPEKEDVIQTIVLTYQTIRQNNEELFSINCIEARPKNALHQRMRVHILNIVRKLRIHYDLTHSTPTDNEMIENIIGRILIFAHLNHIEYHEYFCQLVLPIIHVYYYGVVQSTVIKYDLDLIEALVADSFVKLMSNPIFNHLSTFSSSKYIERLLSQTIEKIKPFSIYQMISNKIEPSLYASRWIKTIFVKDLDFAEAIKLWDYLFDKISSKNKSIQPSKSSVTISNTLKPSSSFPSSSEAPHISLFLSQSTVSLTFDKFNVQINDFHINIILFCASCVLAREKACREVQPHKYLETIQNLDEITAEVIISNIENLELQ